MLHILRIYNSISGTTIYVFSSRRQAIEHLRTLEKAGEKVFKTTSKSFWDMHKHSYTQALVCYTTAKFVATTRITEKLTTVESPGKLH
jgi:ABC-type antimicrobial peptide transport system ATPase subunit